MEASIWESTGKEEILLDKVDNSLGELAIASFSESLHADDPIRKNIIIRLENLMVQRFALK